MICVSLADLSYERCETVLDGIELAEIRLDRCDFTRDQIERLFSLPKRLVATFRPDGRSYKERLDLLLLAISSGASYVDVELVSPGWYKRRIADAAAEKNCKVIVSFHDFHGTPPVETIHESINRCFEAGADIAKVAYLSRSEDDVARILSLYDRTRWGAGRLIAIGMGRKGRITRIAAPFLGAPFTYAAHARGAETADGQFEHQTIRALIDGVSRG